MLGRFLGAAILVWLVSAPAAALAVPTDSPAPSPSPNAAVEHPHDGGIISGKITSVNLQNNTIAVNKTSIMVMPSTQIQGNDPGYHAITDLRPGMSVDVYTSQVAGKYIAQIITLR